jgi:hypothetical protein
MPLPLIVPIIVLGGAALALAAGKKKGTAPTAAPAPAVAPEALTFEQSRAKVYNEAMASNDLDFIGRTATWMQAFGNNPAMYDALQKHYQDVYKQKAQTAAYNAAVGGPPTPSDLDGVYQTAMGSEMTNTGQLEWAGALLRANGRGAQADMVEKKRQSLLTPSQTPPQSTAVAPSSPAPVIVTTPAAPQPDPVTYAEPGGFSGKGTVPTSMGPEQSLPVPTAIPSPAATPTPTPTAIQQAETAPQADPNGTISLARTLIGIESSSGWKSAFQPEIKQWQAKVGGLTADGKFGPKSALRMADEVGVLPLIRYWAATGGTKDQQLSNFRSALLAKASALESVSATKPHGVALRVSAAHEQGQGYPASPKALPADDATLFAQKVNAAIQALRTA